LLSEFCPALELVTLRAETSADEPFLRELYASTRANELAQVPDWSASQRTEFLDMQFDAQRSYYREHFPAARFDIIEVEEKPVGRLYLALGEESINLMDIALLPEHRGAGIGGALTGAVQSFAASHGIAVLLHVEETNAAMRLYQRLGFEVVGEQTFYKKMRWVS
jgi:ribosomal protein S18 acetylase RimI-like enzyme